MQFSKISNILCTFWGTNIIWSKRNYFNFILLNIFILFMRIIHCNLPIMQLWSSLLHALLHARSSLHDSKQLIWLLLQSDSHSIISFSELHILVIFACENAVTDKSIKNDILQYIFILTLFLNIMKEQLQMSQEKIMWLKYITEP